MRTLIVDDHLLFTEGLKLLLHNLDCDLVINCALSSAGARKLLEEHHYDLLLLDFRLPDSNGLETIRACSQLKQTAVVVISGEDNPNLITQIIDAGAMGFIPKSSSPEVLIRALRLVLAGGVYLPPLILDQCWQELNAEEMSDVLRNLTTRQYDVLRCLIQGKSNKAIAEELHVSEGTVKSHISTMLQILGVRNRTEAVFMAAKLGMQLH